MANWIVADELDTRLRERYGVEDPVAFIERLIADHFDTQNDENPDVRAMVEADIKASQADIKVGRVTEARQAMRELAEKHGFDFDR